MRAPPGGPGEVFRALLPTVLGAAMVATTQPCPRGFCEWVCHERSMSEQKLRAICIGEALIELARGADGRFALTCGGDTFNTAVYLARAGVDVAFATAIGDDRYSDSVVALATAEGVSSDLVLRVPGRLPAVCLVENESAGNRNIRIWREGAP